MESSRVVFRKYGDPNVLEVERVALAPPGPGQVLVDVAFSGINFGDCVARRGFYQAAPPPPACVGFEASGTIAAVGPGVTQVRVGDRVLCITRFGGYASKLVLEQARVKKIPDAMSLEEAAAIPAVYLTAWHSLHEVARVRAGESILIQAVAGGVGLAALQLAKHYGMTTYGTASSQKKLDVAAKFGLDHGINYVTDDFEAKIKELTQGLGVHVVLDSLGGEGLKKGYRCLALGGLAVTIGAAQVAPNSKSIFSLMKAGLEIAKGGAFFPLKLIEHNRGVVGVQVLYWWDDLAHMDRAMTDVLALYAQGVVKPVIDSVFTFENAARAHAKLESRGTAGKVLLSPT